MNRILFLVLVLITFMLLLGCSNKAADACKQFTKAIEARDFSGAKEFATDASSDLLNQAQFYWEQLSIAEKEETPRKTFNIVDTVIRGETAIVTLDEIDGQDRSRKETRELKMEKEDGVWKVQLDKESESILPGS